MVFESQIPNSTLRRSVFAINTTLHQKLPLKICGIWLRCGVWVKHHRFWVKHHRLWSNSTNFEWMIWVESGVMNQTNLFWRSLGLSWHDFKYGAAKFIGGKGYLDLKRKFWLKYFLNKKMGAVWTNSDMTLNLWPAQGGGTLGFPGWPQWILLAPIQKESPPAIT